MQDLFDWRSTSPKPIIGVDEVGRGCLAGDVYAAAVILNEDISQFPWFSQLTDSKLLSEKRREELSSLILQTQQVSIAFATVEEIDRMNILKASLLAMSRAVNGLNVSSGHILVDGTFRIPHITGFQQTCLIKGDRRAAPISAASIVAKVTRDRIMKELGVTHPHYGFEEHKGYATVLHKGRIKEYGPIAVHRKTFAGVREYLSRSSL